MIIRKTPKSLIPKPNPNPLVKAKEKPSQLWIFFFFNKIKLKFPFLLSNGDERLEILGRNHSISDHCFSSAPLKSTSDFCTISTIEDPNTPILSPTTISPAPAEEPMAVPAVQFPIFLAVRVLGMIVAALVSIWALHFRGGLALVSDNKDLIFNVISNFLYIQIWFLYCLWFLFP